MLKLRYDDTVGALRACLNAHLARGAAPGASTAAAGAAAVGVGRYEIRSAFPARAYADEEETLRAAGLVPNATLFLRAL